MMVERYYSKSRKPGTFRWLVVGRGRTVGGIVRRVYGQRYGYQADSGVPGYGLLLRYISRQGGGGASVEGRIRWTHDA